MGYELRAVPRDWVHPEGKALYAGHEYGEHVDVWGETDGTSMIPGEGSYPPPDPADYMPDWLPEEAPCLQWYENVGAGTPVSPVFETEEDAEKWMGENRACAQNIRIGVKTDDT